MTGAPNLATIQAILGRSAFTRFLNLELVSTLQEISPCA
jgi:hypothetical protein